MPRQPFPDLSHFILLPLRVSSHLLPFLHALLLPFTLIIQRLSPFVLTSSHPSPSLSITFSNKMHLSTLLVLGVANLLNHVDAQSQCVTAHPSTVTHHVTSTETETETETKTFSLAWAHSSNLPVASTGSSSAIAQSYVSLLPSTHTVTKTVTETVQGPATSSSRGSAHRVSLDHGPVYVSSVAAASASSVIHHTVTIHRTSTDVVFITVSSAAASTLGLNSTAPTSTSKSMSASVAAQSQEAGPKYTQPAHQVAHANERHRCEQHLRGKLRVRLPLTKGPCRAARPASAVPHRFDPSGTTSASVRNH